ncbi:MAG TPA: TIGR04283 family arsenosugar biosynthesis glycosyltransferase [Nitrospiraceae bacterium]|nr:TIGR04283 family arsenosugar biosynthesis glycosyltransferase [Nitrospiraceae bacterium]
MVSVVIPAYNEEKALPHTLRELLCQCGDHEIIVVDGDSTDRTRAIVESFGFIDSPSNPRRVAGQSRDTRHVSRFTFRAPKGRASQMNAGAKEAIGDWLLFLHADTVLPSGAIQRLNEMEADHSIQAGGFMHQFSGDDWRLKLISFLDNFRCTRSRIIYGDQALFVRRALFEQLGGFPNRPILEDVAFCERLISVTMPRLLSPPVITDARKFLKMGVWRSFLRVLLIILHVEFRLPVLPRAFFRDVR